MGVSITIQDNSREFRKELEDRIPKALEKCGLVAEGYAKRLCPVGTPESTGVPGYIGGTLRNSITHALDGESAFITEYSDNEDNVKGKYEGTAPKESGKLRSVYIGTNVEYGPYVEMGTSSMTARPYIKPAVANHAREYKQIMEDIIKNG